MIRTWFCGNFINVSVGTKFFIGRCGSGRSVFGEFAILERTTSKYLVFKTESGSILYTKKDNLNCVSGGMGKEGWWVSPLINRVENVDFIKDTVKYWNEKKCTFMYK